MGYGSKGLEPSVLRDLRHLTAGSAVSTYMTGVSGPATRGGPALRLTWVDIQLAP